MLGVHGCFPVWIRPNCWSHCCWSQCLYSKVFNDCFSLQIVCNCLAILNVIDLCKEVSIREMKGFTSGRAWKQQHASRLYKMVQNIITLIASSDYDADPIYTCLTTDVIWLAFNLCYDCTTSKQLGAVWPLGHISRGHIPRSICLGGSSLRLLHWASRQAGTPPCTGGQSCTLMPCCPVCKKANTPASVQSGAAQHSMVSCLICSSIVGSLLVLFCTGD